MNYRALRVPPRHAFVSLTLACLPLATTTACARTETRATGEPVASASVPVAVRVTVARVERARTGRILELSGSLAALEQSAVAIPVGGVVEQVKVDVGDRVRRGDVLVTLDGRDAALRLAAARALERQQRAALGLIEGGPFSVDRVPDVRAANEQAALALREAERARRLLDAGVLSPAQAETAESQAATAVALAEKARHGAAQAHAALRAARAQAHLSANMLRYMRVVAPFDGAVAVRRVAPGEFVAAGSVAVVVVADHVLRLQVAVPEASIAGLERGARVEVSSAALPGRVFEGKLTRLGAAVDSASRTLPVEAEIPNPDHALRPGLFVRARVSLPGEPVEVLTVPAASITSSGSAFRVFVRVGERVEERLVVPLRTLGDRREVRGDLKAGDEVVVEGAGQLADGDPVILDR